MLSFSLRFCCVFVLAGSAAGGALADPAPITYAGQRGALATQTASLEGGGEASYGYGASQSRSSESIIDLRRPTTPPRASRVASDSAPPARSAATSLAGEQGAQAWLEREQVGPPYQANGRWYVPTPEPGYSESGVASWYGPSFHGQRTASGETYDQEALTAAHPTLPLQSLVQVTNLENGREVIVRINDRGPFVDERLIDLSRRSAEVLGFEQAGRARVNVRYLGPAPRRVPADGVAAAAQPSSASLQSSETEPGPVSLLPESAAAPVGAPLYSDAAAGQSLRAAPAASTPAGGQFLQVGAFSDLANANRVREALADVGPVSIHVLTTATGLELFRVRVGPWTSPQEAAAAQRRLAELGYGQAIFASR